MASNSEMVEKLKENGDITSKMVEEAFLNVDRVNFIPEKSKDIAYADRPVFIAQDATISAPHMVAINTELLELEEDDRVLEIGSGSGYQLAILSELADEVTGIEINKQLVEWSREKLESRENVHVVHGDGLDAVEGNFDKIIYSCAIESMDNAKKRLKSKGIIVAPVKEKGYQVLQKFKNGKIEEHEYVTFVEMK